MPARVQRDYHVGDRVLVKGPKGDNLPKPAGRKRAQRRKYAAVITAVPDEARGRVGYRVIYDGGHPRREGRVPKNDISDIPHDYDGRAVTSPLPAGAPRLDDDAEPGSENEDDEFFDPEVEEDGDLDEDERVEGPGQRLLDDEADIRDLVGETVALSHEHFGNATWTVVEPQYNIADNAASELMPARDDRRRNICPSHLQDDAGFELNLFREMLWMPIHDMVDIINSENARQRALPSNHDDHIPAQPHFQELSPHDLGKFFGLLIGAGAMGRGGAPCWYDARGPQLFNHPHYEEHMLKHRFKQIRRLVPWVMQDRSDTSAWHRVHGAVDMFNKRRREVLGCFRHVIADELMSAFVSQHPTAYLPNITYEPRKPEPLGTMLKCLQDNDTKVMSTLEICEGAQRNRAMAEGIHRYTTTACTVRMLRATVPESGVLKRVVCGDSWFASVMTAVAVMKGLGLPRDADGRIVTPTGLADASAAAHPGSHFIGVVKTYAALFPKAYIEDKLRGKSAGARIVLEATVDGVDLVAVGWKYKRSSTLCYIATKGAASTADDPDNPYTMAIKDVEGNKVERTVPRPEIVGKYYSTNGGIDVHNKMRQGDLALEKHWVTHDPYFRIFTTLIGICVTDAFNVLKYRVGARRGDYRREWTLREYASVLAHQLVNNPWDDNENLSRRQRQRLEGEEEQEEDVMCLTLTEMEFNQHVLEEIPGQRAGGGRKQLWCTVCPATGETKKYQTSYMCSGPGCVGNNGGRYCGVCPQKTGRDCFDIHRGIVRATPAIVEPRRGREMGASTGGPRGRLFSTPRST